MRGIWNMRSLQTLGVPFASMATSQSHEGKEERVKREEEFWNEVWERWNQRKKMIERGETTPQDYEPLYERIKEASKYDERWDYRNHKRVEGPRKYFRYKETDAPRGQLYFPAPVSLRWFHVRERREDPDTEDSASEMSE